MTVESIITEKLAQRFDPEHLEVINESSNHNVPPGSESHFKVVLVSREFEALPLIKRHRLVNAALAEELRDQIHALALHTYTAEDWHRRHGDAPMSPPCLGGEKPSAA